MFYTLKKIFEEIFQRKIIEKFSDEFYFDDNDHKDERNLLPSVEIEDISYLSFKENEDDISWRDQRIIKTTPKKQQNEKGEDEIIQNAIEKLLNIFGVSGEISFKVTGQNDIARECALFSFLGSLSYLSSVTHSNIGAEENGLFTQEDKDISSRLKVQFELEYFSLKELKRQQDDYILKAKFSGNIHLFFKAIEPIKRIEKINFTENIFQQDEKKDMDNLKFLLEVNSSTTEEDKK